MEIEEFLKLFASLKQKGWKGFLQEKRFRLRQGGVKGQSCHCPITAVCFVATGKSYEPGHARRSSRKISLESIVYSKIVHAADNLLFDRGKFDAEVRILRRKLLAIFAIAEPEVLA